MSSIIVVIADVLFHNGFQMALIEHDHMVEQVPAVAANPTPGDTVLPGTSVAGSLGLNAEALHGVDHLRIEAGTAIKDQISGCRVVGKCFAQLLNDPGAGWMPGHVEVEDAPPVMRNDKKAIKNFEGERWYGEEVHRGYGLAMIIEECHPTLCRFGISRRLAHPTQHSSLRNIEAKDFNFPVDARRTPSGVLGDHAEDEVAQSFADAFSSHACPMPREPRPRQLEPRLVPANDGLRLDKDQCPLPSRPEPLQDHPEQLVASSKSRLWALPLQDAKLLPQRQVFQKQVTSRTGKANEQDEQKPHRTRHEPLVAEPPRKSSGVRR